MDVVLSKLQYVMFHCIILVHNLTLLLMYTEAISILLAITNNSAMDIIHLPGLMCNNSCRTGIPTIFTAWAT